MEFRYTEESKSWSEESDERSEHNNDERGSGRSYECVFCKRGFTTAQALGGHMNIHRKDRAKSTKPSFHASTSTKLLDDHHEIDHAISSFPPPGNYSDHNSNYNYNYPPSQISFPAVHHQYSDQRDRDLFRGDYNWRTGLSLSNPLYLRDNNKEKLGDSGEEDGLDLELRLGYHS